MNVSDQKVEPQLVSMDERYFEVELPKSIDPGKSGTGEVTLAGQGLMEDKFEKSFTIQLNDADSTRFTIPVKRTVRRNVNVGAAPGGGGGK